MTAISFNELCLAAQGGGAIRINQGPGIFSDEIKEKFEKMADHQGHFINWWTDKFEMECIHYNSDTFWYLTCRIEYQSDTLPIIKTIKLGMYLCKHEVPVEK